MSALVSEATEAARRGAESAGLPLTPGIVATVLIIVFLVQREVLRATAAPARAHARSALSVFIPPLLFVFAVTAGARFAELLR